MYNPHLLASCVISMFNPLIIHPKLRYIFRSVSSYSCDTIYSKVFKVAVSIGIKNATWVYITHVKLFTLRSWLSVSIYVKDKDKNKCVDRIKTYIVFYFLWGTKKHK